MPSPYLLAAVRREHRRLTVVCQSMDRRATPPAVVALIEDAMLTLDDAAHLLENIDPAAPLPTPLGEAQHASHDLGRFEP